jgi:hypothetical protein
MKVNKSGGNRQSVTTNSQKKPKSSFISSLHDLFSHKKKSSGNISGGPSNKHYSPTTSAVTDDTSNLPIGHAASTSSPGKTIPSRNMGTSVLSFSSLIIGVGLLSPAIITSGSAKVIKYATTLTYAMPLAIAAHYLHSPLSLTTSGITALSIYLGHYTAVHVPRSVGEYTVLAVSLAAFTGLSLMAGTPDISLHCATTTLGLVSGYLVAGGFGE